MKYEMNDGLQYGYETITLNKKWNIAIQIIHG